jgi:phosphohistidine phosphatase
VNKFGSIHVDNVPTCGVVGIQFDTNHWKDIKSGKTFLTEFPKNYK